MFFAMMLTQVLSRTTTFLPGVMEVSAIYFIVPTLIKNKKTSVVESVGVWNISCLKINKSFIITRVRLLDQSTF